MDTARLRIHPAKIAMRLGALLLAPIIGAVVLVAPAQATPAPPTRVQIAAALDRVEDGTWTEADLALLRRVPEVGHMVPDPSRPGTLHAREITDEATAAAPMAVALACTTKTWEFYRTKYDIFGDRIYDYVNRTQWCYSGSTVVAIYQAYADLRNQSWGIYLEDAVYSSSGVRHNGTAWHNEKHRVDYCVFVYGCYTSTYPHIDTELSGSSIWVTSSADS